MKPQMQNNAIKLEEIVQRLETTQVKSDSPSEYEKAIRDAFRFLGFEGELLGGSGDTDVLLTANIGQETFKVSVDGKTSKSGKIIDRQIDWISLVDHQKKNNTDFIVVVGPSFAEGNLISRAIDNKVALLSTDELINIIESHFKFPFTLIELRDLFSGGGGRSLQIEDLLTQNRNRRYLLEQFTVIIEEMQSLQDRLGYFTFDSLAGREKLEELEIEPIDVEFVISMLNLPFINGLFEIEPNKYILATTKNDIANIFSHLANILAKIEVEGEIILSKEPEVVEAELKEPKFSTKYYEWFVRGHSIIAVARRSNPYEHFCPLNHFQAIVEKVKASFEEQSVISVGDIFGQFLNNELVPGRKFKGRAEDYKIRLTLAILEIEGLIKWTGSKRPIEYTMNATNEQINNWMSKEVLSKI